MPHLKMCFFLVQQVKLNLKTHTVVQRMTCRLQKRLTGVVAHISVVRKSGNVKTLQHVGVPLLAVLAVVENVVHGGG